MAVFGSEALTLSDMRKRLNPDGTTAFIVEALEQSNPILKDIPWIEGNLKTGNVTTVRTMLPTPSIRMINRGVKRGKSRTKQVQDTCMILEDRSVVDIELLALQKDKERFRASEDAAFVQGFSNYVAEQAFYGDSSAEPGTFNGISIRYNTYGGEKGEAGYQVLSAGTPGSNTNTTAFFIGWGQKNTVGIYPEGTLAGLKMRDLGEQTVLDSDNLEYQGLATLFTWKCGLAVQNIRSNALLRNINVAGLNGLNSAQKLALMDKLTVTKNRIQNLQNGDKKVVLYVSDSLYDFFECYLNDKTNVFVTQQTLMGAMPQLYFKGILVQKCDAISETETACPASA
jgi:hypothetical protein